MAREIGQVWRAAREPLRAHLQSGVADGPQGWGPYKAYVQFYIGVCTFSFWSGASGFLQSLLRNRWLSKTAKDLGVESWKIRLGRNGLCFSLPRSSNTVEYHLHTTRGWKFRSSETEGVMFIPALFLPCTGKGIISFHATSRCFPHPPTSKLLWSVSPKCLANPFFPPFLLQLQLGPQPPAVFFCLWSLLSRRSLASYLCL